MLCYSREVMEKRWEIVNKRKTQPLDSTPGRSVEFKAEEIRDVILANRGIEGVVAVKKFLRPTHPREFVVHPSRFVQISATDLERAGRLVIEALASSRPIVIHGDYDVDGLCATAILWEAIYFGLGYRRVHPFIPDRLVEGYGLSTKSLDRVLVSLLPDSTARPLVISVDCGIVAHLAVDYAKSRGWEIIVTDHHARGQQLPKADALVWTDQVCGAGIAWILAQELLRQSTGEVNDSSLKHPDWGLDLVALATVADVQPLLGPNRPFVKFGLEELNRTPRVGLQALIKEAGLRLKSSSIGVYEVGWILAPRLNAAGRLSDAMDALRLLCTRSEARARVLAQKLSSANRERQQLTSEMFAHAKEELTPSKLITVAHESYHEGVIGLVAGKLAQEFYRPAVVISRGEEFSKGSARSIAGFNIIEAIRECQDLVVNAGGHPLAAGFTIKTAKIEEFWERLLRIAEKRLLPELLQPVLKIDCGLDLGEVSWELWEILQALEPFGVGNPRPKFVARSVTVVDLGAVGGNGTHLKLKLTDSGGAVFSAIGFGLGGWVEKLQSGDRIDLVYSLWENSFSGSRRLELKVEDLRPTVSS